MLNLSARYTIGRLFIPSFFLILGWCALRLLRGTEVDDRQKAIRVAYRVESWRRLPALVKKSGCEGQ
jgi:hypothetical protein